MNDVSTALLRLDTGADASVDSDGAIRYGAYLRDNQALFADPDEKGRVTCDPAEFAVAAWTVATGPVMSSPVFVRIHERVLATLCARDPETGGLHVGVELAAPPPADLVGVTGWLGWQRTTFGYVEPDPARPAMLTVVRLVVPITPLKLPALVEAPERIALWDAVETVRTVVSAVNRAARPVLAALNGDA